MFQKVISFESLQKKVKNKETIEYVHYYPLCICLVLFIILAYFLFQLFAFLKKHFIFMFEVFLLSDFHF